MLNSNIHVRSHAALICSAQQARLYHDSCLGKLAASVLAEHVVARGPKQRGWGLLRDSRFPCHLGLLQLHRIGAAFDIARSQFKLAPGFPAAAFFQEVADRSKAFIKVSMHLLIAEWGRGITLDVILI